jgi:hypothetical protein
VDHDRPAAWGYIRRLASLLNDEQLASLLNLENEVIAKLPPPNMELAKLLSAESRESWLRLWRPRQRSCQPDEDVWLRYWDEADLERLTEFIGSVLPSALATFLEAAKSGSAGTGSEAT